MSNRSEILNVIALRQVEEFWFFFIFGNFPIRDNLFDETNKLILVFARVAGNSLTNATNFLMCDANFIIIIIRVFL